jgi:hypothetical protein
MGPLRKELAGASESLTSAFTLFLKSAKSRRKRLLSTPLSTSSVPNLEADLSRVSATCPATNYPKLLLRSRHGCGVCQERQLGEVRFSLQDGFKFNFNFKLLFAF